MQWHYCASEMMNIVKATRRYEAWLAEHTLLDASDLRLKHKRMAEGLFPFFRATFYRWMQLWPEACPSLCSAPEVLAVGDLHVENFGTWRDVEGRLIWGINDLMRPTCCRIPSIWYVWRRALTSPFARRGCKSARAMLAMPFWRVTRRVCEW